MFLNKRQIILKKFGFFKDQNGIINRYLREKEAWQAHLSNTRDFIINSSMNKDNSKAVILGSGWLLDIPVDELSKKY